MRGDDVRAVASKATNLERRHFFCTAEGRRSSNIDDFKGNSFSCARLDRLVSRGYEATNLSLQLVGTFLGYSCE